MKTRGLAMLNLDRFRAVIFDFDGVIVDSETMQADAWTRVARELGRAECEIAPARIAGRLDAELAEELFPGCDAPGCAQRKAQIEAEMESAGELRLVPGVADFVRRLFKTHALAICSSCRREVIERRLERFDLRPAFRAIVGRVDGVPHKPAPDQYLRTLNELGITATAACAIEDSPTGVAAAKAAHVYTIQLLHPYMPRAAEADEWIARF